MRVEFLLDRSSADVGCADICVVAAQHQQRQLVGSILIMANVLYNRVVSVFVVSRAETGGGKPARQQPLVDRRQADSQRLTSALEKNFSKLQAHPNKHLDKLTNLERWLPAAHNESALLLWLVALVGVSPLVVGCSVISPPPTQTPTLTSQTTTKVGEARESERARATCSLECTR